MDICYSNNDILNKLKHKCRVITYDKVDDYEDIDDLLGKHGACVILYEQKNNFGHWCCVFKNGDTVYFFDSYGVFPDDQLEEIDLKFRLKSGQAYRTLSALMALSPYNIDYNDHQLQSNEENINTCGRWCVARILNKHLTSDEFYDVFGPGEDKVEPDELVVNYTDEL
jgi:hypothetical protein